MAKKKSKKKNQSTETQDSGLLGGRLNGIAVALLTTLVTEIVQQVLDRLFPSNAQPGAASSDSEETDLQHSLQHFEDKAEREDRPVTVTAGAVNDSIGQAKPLMQDVLRTIQTTIQEATPRLNEAIAVLQASSNDPKRAVATLVRDAVSGTKENLDNAAASTASTMPDLNNWLSSAMAVTQSAIDSIATADSEEAEEKGKKKKGKKKKGKKSKK